MARLEEVLGVTLAKLYPRVPSAGFWTDNRVSDHELRIDAELHELAPRPQREVLAIASAHQLERARMLPEVGYLVRINVARVLTLA